MHPDSGVTFSCENPILTRLFETASQKCLENIKSFGEHQVLVEGGGYEKIWLETQPMGGEMYAKQNLRVGLANQLLFMQNQRADGRLPGSIQCVDGTPIPQFDKFQGFCFPDPALNMYYLAGQDDGYLSLLERTLLAFDAYLWRVRDSNGDGLLESFCVYDTGEDHAVRYGDAPNWWSLETPPTDSRVVPMASMDVTSFSYSARKILADIAAIRGDAPARAHWLAQAQQVARALRDGLWDDAIGACFDRDRFGATIPVLTHNSLRCMYWGSLSPEMAARFVREHLLNPNEFYTSMPLPSVAVNDPAFRNNQTNDWSGQCEGLTYQRAIRALENYGFEPLVTALGKRLLDAVHRGGYVFTQQFDPFTGEPSRVHVVSQQGKPNATDMQDAYGPTLLSVLEYIAHLYGVHIEREEVYFSLVGGERYCYEQRWGERRYRIESDGTQGKIYIDGRLRHTVPCGTRLITTWNGQVKRARLLESNDLSKGGNLS